MTDIKLTASGSCLCGGVKYEIYGPLRDVNNCHCSMCRRTHGNIAAYTLAKKQDLKIVTEKELKWYSSSEGIRRGFCGNCGGSIFWERTSSEHIGISAGTLDMPTGLKTANHIFVEDASDYYEINDDVPKHSRWA